MSGWQEICRSGIAERVGRQMARPSQMGEAGTGIADIERCRHVDENEIPKRE